MDELIYLARSGYRFLPAAGPDWQGDWDRGKQPLVAWDKAAGDPATLKGWAEKYRGCNWWCLADDGLAVLDIDPRHGGDRLLADLEAEYGKLPLTARSVSGRGDGGGHLLFAVSPHMVPCKGNVRGNEGLTFICGGKGGVIVPPSRHPLGGAYRWGLAPWDVGPAPCPGWLVAEAMAQAQPEPRAGGCAGASAPAAEAVRADDPLDFTWGASGLADHPGEGEGQRNRTLCRLVGAALAAGHDADGLEAEVVAWAGRCDPPLPEAQAVRVLHSLAAKDGRDNKHNTPSPVRVSEVPPAVGLVEGGKSGTNSDEALAPAEFFPPEVLSTHPGDEPAGRGGVHSTLSTVPPLGEEAFHGLVGDIARAVEPELAGRVEGVVFGLLSAVGNCVGPGPFVRVGTERHKANLFGCVVAPSGVGKSEPWSVVSSLMAWADPSWVADCVLYGLGSGEGLIERVRDPRLEQQAVREKGRIIGWDTVEFPGADEKRCCCVETEFGGVLTKARREGSTLSPTLCGAWDAKPLETANAGQAKRKATDHHISLWANITQAELDQRLSQSLEAVNGFSNRFVWLWQERVRNLPFGGEPDLKMEPFVNPLAEALAKAKCVQEVRWSEAAKAIWVEAYPRLCDAQEQMPALGRARSQALRLSLVYALVDGSDTLQPEHIRAGLAAWAWAEASARLIFGGGGGDGCAGGPPHAAQALGAIRRTPGLGRSAIWSVVGHKAKASQLSDALAWLEAGGLAHSRVVKPQGGGRPAECWWPGPRPEPRAVTCGDGPGQPAQIDIPPLDNNTNTPPVLGAAVGGVERTRAEAGIQAETPTTGGGGKNSVVEETPAVPTPPAAGGEIIPSFHHPGGVARREAEVVAEGGGKNSGVEETPAEKPQAVTAEEKVISFHQAEADATNGGVCGVVVPHEVPTSTANFAGGGVLASLDSGRQTAWAARGYSDDYRPLTAAEVEELLGDPPPL